MSADAGQIADWLTVEPEAMPATVTRLPAAADISLPVDVNLVIEFLTR